MESHFQQRHKLVIHLRSVSSNLLVFACSPTANRYMLRALAQAGGGTYEFFDTKTKYTWAEKVSFTPMVFKLDLIVNYV